MAAGTSKEMCVVGGRSRCTWTLHSRPHGWVKATGIVVGCRWAVPGGGSLVAAFQSTLQPLHPKQPPSLRGRASQ